MAENRPGVGRSTRAYLVDPGIEVPTPGILDRYRSNDKQLFRDVSARLTLQTPEKSKGKDEFVIEGLDFWLAIRPGLQGYPKQEFILTFRTGSGICPRLARVLARVLEVPRSRVLDEIRSLQITSELTMLRPERDIKKPIRDGFSLRFGGPPPSRSA